MTGVQALGLESRIRLRKSSVAVVVAVLAYGIYYAAAEGTLKAWVAALVPAERRGAAYGLYAAASGILVLPASVIAGGLWDR